MALRDLLQLNEKRKKIGISEERIEAIKPHLRQYIAFWREYPDLFVDFLQTGGNPDIEPEFKFFAYQRVFLRAAMRYNKIILISNGINVPMYPSPAVCIICYFGW